MGPQVERCFVRGESPVNVVKSTPQPSEMINILYDCTCQYVFNIKLKLFKIRANNSQWKQLKNSFRWQRLKVTQIQSRTFRQIPVQLTARWLLMVVKTTTFYANHWD